VSLPANEITENMAVDPQNDWRFITASLTFCGKGKVHPVSFFFLNIGQRWKASQSDQKSDWPIYKKE
jgi:hypothetical protein